MNRATPEMRAFAKRLIADEMEDDASSGTETPAAFHVSQKLRAHLATLMGTGGFRALLSRALALSTAEVRWLRSMHVQPAGSLAGLEGLRAQPDPDELFEGRVVLLAQLLELLVAFIGEDLTLRVVREVWPKAAINGFGFGNGGKK